MSQIGYMFLALGVGAWSAAIFHFMTHAFFKALLFLSAGSVIHSLHHEQDIFRMGGLRTKLPYASGPFVIGAASLAGFPLVTAGFYSKDGILMDVWASPMGGPWLWAADGRALITAAYSFRLVFVVFFGEQRTAVGLRPGLTRPATHHSRGVLPRGRLRRAAEGAGECPVLQRVDERSAAGDRTWRHSPPKRKSIAGLRDGGFPARDSDCLRGIPSAPRPRDRSGEDQLGRSPVPILVRRVGFDRLYDALFVRPFLWVARVNKDDLSIISIAVWPALPGSSIGVLHQTQTGQVRWYAAVLATGSARDCRPGDVLMILAWLDHASAGCRNVGLGS